MLNVDRKRTTSVQGTGVLTWELGSYGDRVTYSPPSGAMPQISTDLSFTNFSRTVPIEDQAIHELLHPFGRQLALRYGKVLSEWNNSGAWNGVELGLFDARVELLVVGLQRQLFPEKVFSAPTVRFSYFEETSAPNRWLQGASELLGAALLQGDDGEPRANAIRTALLPALAALSGSCELSESCRDRTITVNEPPIFSPIERPTILATLEKALNYGLQGRLFEQLGDSDEAKKLSDLFLSVYGNGSNGINLLLRDFTDCYPGPEFSAHFSDIQRQRI